MFRACVICYNSNELLLKSLKQILDALKLASVREITRKTNGLYLYVYKLLASRGWTQVSE